MDGPVLVKPQPQDLHDLGQPRDKREEFQRGSSIDGVPETRGPEPDQQLIAMNICK